MGCLPSRFAPFAARAGLAGLAGFAAFSAFALGVFLVAIAVSLAFVESAATLRDGARQGCRQCVVWFSWSISPA